MHQVFQQYEERLRRLRAKPYTLRNHAYTARLFTESGLDPLKAQDWEIEEWLLGLPLADRTRRLHYENLNAVFRYAAHRRMLPASPLETVRLPREPDVEPHILETSELRCLLERAVTDQEVLMLHLYIYTGMRKSEGRALRWEHVRFADNTITILSGKGDKLRHIPLHPRLSEVLIECGRPREHQNVLAGPRGKGVSDNCLQHRLVKVRGDVDASFHDFRRTATSSLVKNGAPYEAIDRIMGWSPRSVRSRYYTNVAPDALQEAILRLYADNPL